MQHDSIIVELPFVVKTIFGKKVKQKKIGFNFTNRLLFILMNRNDLKSNSDLKQLTEKNGQQWVINESLYCAYLAYCDANKIESTITIDQLMKAIVLADSDIQQQIMKCWELSQTFGASFKKKEQTIMKQKK